MTTSTTPVDKGLSPLASTPERDAQWQRDLAILERIEDERLCFFCAMGHLHAQQKREASAMNEGSPS